MGIKFGGGAAVPAGDMGRAVSNVHNPAYPNTRSGVLKGGQWDPSLGVRFG